MMSGSIHLDVEAMVGLLARLQIPCSTALAEVDNARYGAATAQAGTLKIRFRTGKLTPTKTGLFVAVWRRAIDGSTEPFPAGEIDLLAITARAGARSGIFIFPDAALVEHGIASRKNVGGKRGFRVYPPWSVPSNAQALRTQAWQVAYFLSLDDGVDITRARQLLS